MKKFSTVQQLLLSLPVILILFYQLTFLFPTDFTWLVPSMKAYYIQIGILASLYLSLLFILLKRIWKYKNIDRKLKSDWTWYLILFGSITTLIYLWKIDNEFQLRNNSNQ